MLLWPWPITENPFNKIQNNRFDTKSCFWFMEFWWEPGIYSLPGTRYFCILSHKHTWTSVTAVSRPCSKHAFCKIDTVNPMIMTCNQRMEDSEYTDHAIQTYIFSYKTIDLDIFVLNLGCYDIYWDFQMKILVTVWMSIKLKW